MRQINKYAAAVVLTLAAAATWAQSPEVKAKLRAMKPADFPNRAIELSLGHPAGGGIDVTARLVAQKFQEYSGEPMVINNRVGAGGMVFHRWVATQAPADGYSIGVASNLIIGDTLLRADNKWSYRDVDNLAFINYEPVVWLASTSGKFRNQSLADILKAAKADSGSVRVGTVATSFFEMLAEQVEQKHGLTFTKVPYNGGPPSLAALMGDHIDISFGFLGEFQGLGDKVRPIAVASNRPVSYLPGVPTFNSVLGTDDVNWIIWRFVVAPKGVPANRKAWLVAVFNEVMKDPQLLDELQKRGGTMDANLDTPAKVTAELERLAQGERKFYLQTGRLKQ